MLFSSTMDGPQTIECDTKVSRISFRWVAGSFKDVGKFTSTIRSLPTEIDNVFFSLSLTSSPETKLAFIYSDHRFCGGGGVWWVVGRGPLERSWVVGLKRLLMSDTPSFTGDLLLQYSGCNVMRSS